MPGNSYSPQNPYSWHLLIHCTEACHLWVLFLNLWCSLVLTGKCERSFIWVGGIGLETLVRYLEFGSAMFDERGGIGEHLRI